MSRHNRKGTGTDQAGIVWTVVYPPGWLDKVKITRLRPGGRQSTMTLFRNPERSTGIGLRGGSVRLRVRSEEAGVDVELTLSNSAGPIRRAAVDVELPPASAGAQPQPVTFTFYPFR